MSKQLDSIDENLAKWVGQQKIFFVATAPLSASQHINLSPKGGDSFRVLGPMEVVYQDYTGSGAETAAHVRENGRIIIMFCAFEGAPNVVRLHGRARIVANDDPSFQGFAALFPPNPGTRAFVQVQVTRVSTSCGFSVPLFEYLGPRDTLDKWAVNKGEQALREYRAQKNRLSIDGLPALLETGI